MGGVTDGAGAGTRPAVSTSGAVRASGPAPRPAEAQAPGSAGAAAVLGTGPVQRALAAELAAVRHRRPGRPPRVLDVGGGSGAWAVPLARAGCAVTVVDASPDALASLHRRAREAGVADLVTPVQGDVDALAEALPGGGDAAAADLVLGHGLLEVVDDAAAAVAALRGAAAPGAVVSVLVTGRYAAVLARTLAGRLAEARALLADPDGRTGPHDPLRRRLDAAGLDALLTAAGLDPVLLQGDGVLEGWVPGGLRDGGSAAGGELGALEELAASALPLRDVAARLHALARRPS